MNDIATAVSKDLPVGQRKFFKMPTAERITPGFTPADVDHPPMTYDGSDLTLTFQDWREKIVRVVFRGVPRFNWSDEPDVFSNGLFQHRLLFSSGIELQIDFSDFKLDYKDLRSG